MLKLPDGTKPNRNPQEDGLGYNPRCLARDFNAQAAAEATDILLTGLIKNATDIVTFQTLFQGEFPLGRMRPHTAGHYMIGGDASDFYFSPTDPAFFPHHAMVDRYWWIWQNQDIEKRQMAMEGTTQIRGIGPNATLDDTIHMHPWTGAANITIRDGMNTLAGPFCYIYM